MSNFATDFAETVADHLEWFGQVATYRVPGADDVTVTVSVARERTDEEQSGPARLIRSTREIRIPRDPTLATGGVADPKPNAKLVIDGVAWAITDVDPKLGQTETWTTVRVRRAGVARIERETLRRGGA